MKWHRSVYEEANRMAKSKGKKGDLDLRPFLEKVGLRKFVEALEVREYIDTVGPKKVLKAMGVEQILANLSAEDRQKLKEQLK